MNYLDECEEYEKNCELMYAKLYSFMMNNSKKIYEIRKRIKDGKSVKDKMLRLLKEGKSLFDIDVDTDDIKELKNGNISENIKKQFNKNRYSLSNNAKPKHIKDNKLEIVDNKTTYIIKKEKAFKKIDEENVLNEITDIVGLRIVCYFKEDKKYIHENLIKDLKDQGEIKILEMEHLYPNDCPLKEEEYFRSESFKQTPKDSMYSGIHYIVLLTNDKNKIPIEIQVRTMFEEVFGELEHDISYKYFPTIKSEGFKSVGSMMRTLDHEVQNIKKYIDDKKDEIKNKLMLHYSEDDKIDDKIMEKVFKLMSIHRIEPGSMIESIEKVFKDLDSVFNHILKSDNEMILTFLCFEDVGGRLEDIEKISKHKLIREFFGKLDDLIEKNGIDKCKEILEDLSYIRDSEIINIWLKECRKNIGVIRKHHLSKVVNDMMLEVFDYTFISNDSGLLEHENLVNLLVIIWGWIVDDDKKKWMENIIHYIENSKSKNVHVIIPNILGTFHRYYDEKKISNSDFDSYVPKIEDAFHKKK
jgi:ppGpp synthetase/RelA/SpoT-type nucleotidyltranferase